MSEDKFQDVFPNPATFVAGEQPKGLKYSRWSAQTDEGLRKVERALGNMWASFEIEGDPYPVLFANIARAIGSIDYINPYIPADIDVASHVQGTSAATDANEMYLELFPRDLDFVDGAWLTASTEPAIVPGTGDPGYKADRSQMAESGDWSHEGRVIFTFDPISGGAGEITYEGETRSGDLGMGFSVIPNISQLEDGGSDALELEELVDGFGETYYTVELPYIKKNKQLPDEPSKTEPIIGVSTVRYQLPIHAQLVAGTEIPPGILTLWDAGDPFDLLTASPISENALYYAVSATQFEIRGVELEGFLLGPNNTRYFLVTMDSSLSEAVGLIHRGFINHNHGRDSFVAPVEHGNLSGLAPQNVLRGGGPAGYIKSYGVGSEVEGLDHPNFLYREGYQTTDKGTFYNAMVGDLCLASQDPEAGGFHRFTGAPSDDSFRLTFYREDGPMLYYDLVLDRLVFRSFSATGSPEGGFQFGYSADILGTPPSADYFKVQARFLGPVTVQNYLDVFGDPNDVFDSRFRKNLTIDGTLKVESTGFVDIDSSVDIDGDLDVHGAVHLLDTLEVDGEWDMNGIGNLHANVNMDNGLEIDGIDPSRHRHTTETGHGQQIPVEGIDRVGLPRDPLDTSSNYTGVKINAQGYAVYAP